MLAGARILWEVLLYRLRRLEMANLFAAASLVVALRLPLAEAGIRVLFALLLNVLAYTTNDYYDAERDLAEGRAPDKTQFLLDHRRAAFGAQWFLAACLGAIAVLFDPGLLVAAVLGAGTCWAYSASFKARPVLDVVSMTVWGAAMPLAAVPLDSGPGLILLGQLALFSTCFELLQVLRDRETDAAAGTRTTAVLLGASGTERMFRSAALLSAIYGLVFVHSTFALLLLLGAAVPIRSNPERGWNLVRLVFGLAWLAFVSTLWLTGRTAGVL